MSITYRSISDMNECIIRNLHKFPHDADLIVGVPRSGMLPANLLALYLHKPFTDIDSFIEGRVYSSGSRSDFFQLNNSKKVIIIDDSYKSGDAYTKVQEKLKSLQHPEKYSITYGVVYTSTPGTKIVDYWCEVIDSDRCFQWNLLHHKSIIKNSCFDIDGVLCPNPPVDDDGPQYLKYIKSAPALYIPSVEIDTLVSCRLEKYRAETEKWLKAHNVHYKHLFMLDLPNKSERIKWGKHGEYKAEIYKKSGNILFIESSLAEARVIKQIAHKDVFCTETFEMMNANSPQDKAVHVLRRIKNLIKKVIRIQK